MSFFCSRQPTLKFFAVSGWGDAGVWTTMHLKGQSKMRKMLHRFITIQFAMTIGIAVFGVGRAEQFLRAQAAPQPSQAPSSSSDGVVDDLQRSYKINTYRVAAETGIIRGETIGSEAKGPVDAHL